jgi:TolA-binding protein
LEVADFFERQDRPSDMEPAIEAAAQVGPNDGRLAFYRGVAGVLANANLASAERDLKSYLASTPERSDWPAHAAARVWLGRLYEGQGKRAEAAEQYRAALQLDPQRKEARARLDRLEKSAR